MNIFQMSFSASVLILLVVVIRSFTINRFPKKTFIALWGIIIVRLLTPIAIPSQFSVWNLLNKLGNTDKLATADIVGPNTAIASFNTVQNNTELLLNQIASKSSILMICWLIGVCVALVLFLFTYVKNYQKMQEALLVE